MDNSMTIKELSIGGSTFGISRGTQWGYPVAPGFLGETWGGSSSNIEGDIPIIKFDWCLRGETWEGIWPSGGGGKNIDPIAPWDLNWPPSVGDTFIP